MTSWVSYFYNRSDVVEGVTPTEKAIDYKAFVDEETGKDRLLRVLTPNEFNELSSEVNTVLQVGCMSMFVGAMYGGVLQSRGAYQEFFKNNQATVFKDHLEAKKRLQDKVTVAFGRGAFRFGWRLAFFSTTYIGMSSAVSVYRGKTGIVEHVIAGVITGAIYKFNMGPRGWIVGGGLGLLLGLVAGSTTYGLLKVSGLTMQDVQNRNNFWKEKRLAAFNQGMKEHLNKENTNLLTTHNEKLGIDGQSLDNVK